MSLTYQNRLAVYIFTVFLLFVPLFLSAVWAEDNQINIRAFVDRRTVYIGDRIRLSVELVTGKKVEIKPPEFTASRIGDFEIRQTRKAVKSGFFGSKTTSYQYDIAAYKIGKLTIPELVFRYRNDPRAAWLESRTGPIDIVVKSVLPEGKQVADIKDIKGPIGLRKINWYLFFAATLILSAIIAIVIYIRRRSRRPPKTAYEQAIETLDGIKSSFSTTGNVKEFHVLISDCVRRYIEEAFHLKAPEMTTQEFLASVEASSALSAAHKGLLGIFLSACDMVKFANYSPERNEIEAVSTAARNFIEETKDKGDVHL